MTQEEAIKTVNRIFNYCEEIDYHLPKEEQTGYKMLPDINAVKEYIRNTPDIVRCKDCVHKKARNPIYVNEGRVYCLKYGQYMLNEDFCSYGKKPEYLFFGEAEETK